MRYFNVAGPCNPREHYMVESDRCSGDMMHLINRGQYFVLHAARQSGKTTMLLELTDRINAEGKYYALYCSLEQLQNVSDPQESIPALITCLRDAMEVYGVPNYKSFADDIDKSDYLTALYSSLRRISIDLDKPLIIFFDEADCLSEHALISFLRQLRNGYVTKSRIPFVHSIALIGMRNIRDYKNQIRDEEKSIGSASPFNIITKAFTLNNFTQEEISALYQQHTDETGQQFEPDAVKLVWEKTQGQPWLVNAIAYEIIDNRLKEDFSVTITSEMVLEAINTILVRRDTHIDSMLYRLKEPRVQRIVEPMILGEDATFDWTSDDYQYVCDLGLIHPTLRPMQPANPIYNEMICRALSYSFQEDMANSRTPFVMPRYLRDGKIDMDYLMRDFQQFWRQNSAVYEKKYDYAEAAPHLIMMAFLQRVVNGGGYINRELALGSGRLDLCIDYQGFRYPVELKLRRGPLAYDKAIQQLAGYIDHLGCEEGWLVVFDRRKKPSWKDKIFIRKEIFEGKIITVAGC